MFHRGDVIRKLREKHGWTQTQLAKRAGLNVSSVTRAEENHPQITLDTIGRLAHALAVPVSFLEEAAADVTAAGASASSWSELPSPPSGGPVAESAKTRLHALVQSLDEPEAAILLGLARQWLAQLILRDAKGTPPAR